MVEVVDVEIRNFEMSPDVKRAGMVELMTEQTKPIDPNVDESTLNTLFNEAVSQTNDAFEGILVEVKTVIPEAMGAVKERRLGMKYLPKSVLDKSEGIDTYNTTTIDVNGLPTEVIEVGMDIDGNVFAMLKADGDEKRAVPLQEIDKVIEKSSDGEKIKHSFNGQDVTFINHPEYSNARKEANLITGRNIGKFMETYGFEGYTLDRINDITTQIDIYDSIEIVTRVLKREGVQIGEFDNYAYSPEALLRILETVDPDIHQYYRPVDRAALQVPEGKYTNGSKEYEDERETLPARLGFSSGEEYLKFVEVKARVSQATWLAQQDERAIYENSHDRLAKRNNQSFNNMLICEMANTLINQAESYSGLKDIYAINGINIEDYRQLVDEKDHEKLLDLVQKTLQIATSNSENSTHVGNALYNSILRAGFELHKDIIEPIK